MDIIIISAIIIAAVYGAWYFLNFVIKPKNVEAAAFLKPVVDEVNKIEEMVTKDLANTSISNTANISKIVVDEANKIKDTVIADVKGKQ